jgi:hypothetical protein
MDEEPSRLSPDEAIELALRLGRRDAETYASAHGVSLEDARRKFRQTRQQGRRPSRCMELDDRR